MKKYIYFIAGVLFFVDNLNYIFTEGTATNVSPPQIITKPEYDIAAKKRSKPFEKPIPLYNYYQGHDYSRTVVC